MKYFSNSLTRNSITKSIVRKIIPKKVYSSISVFLNEGSKFNLYYEDNVAVIDSRPLAKVAKGIKIRRHS